MSNSKNEFLVALPPPPPPKTTTTPPPPPPPKTTTPPPPPPPPKTKTTTTTPPPPPPPPPTTPPPPPPPTTPPPPPPKETTPPPPPPPTTPTTPPPAKSPPLTPPPPPPPPPPTPTPSNTIPNDSSSSSDISPAATSDTSSSDESNNLGKQNDGGGVPTAIVIAVAILATLIVSGVIVFFVRKKLKILKSSRGDSANLFEDLDARRRQSARDSSVYKKRTSLLAHGSRILNNNNGNRNVAPTRLITENYSAGDNSSNDVIGRGNNEALTSSRLTRNQSAQHRQNFHHDYQQRQLQQQPQNFYAKAHILNLSPATTSPPPPSHSQPPPQYRPPPPPSRSPPLQYRPPQQYYPQRSPLSQNQVPPMSHVSNSFNDNNNNYSFIQPTQFNYVPRSQMALYPPNSRLNGAQIVQNQQYNRPVDYTNVYGNYNSNNVQRGNNVITGQDNGNLERDTNVADSSGEINTKITSADDGDNNNVE